ncbi:peptidase M24 [Thermotoga sp. Ku-13t]|uniref:M24 family metallopeptidase n=1 Tax=Thermotoga sp. Ku-13t TaxID=1755813 RepID=UPI0013EBCC33|nr:M24 family metallopeptidase [Thermotoga sp. Ku-13t]KAF2957406.1 peptidase M24 [Thermotoga sp. Ku-13t]
MLREAFRERIKTLKKLIEDEHAEALLISRCDNFAWVTFGARNYVTINSEVGSVHFLIVEDFVYILTDNIERKRIEQEELSEDIANEVEFAEYMWSKGLWDVLKSFVQGKRLLSDTGWFDSRNVSDKLKQLRLVLAEPEIETYRWIGKNCDEIFSNLMPKFSPEMTEWEVQSQITQAFVERGIEPVLVLVFGEESAQLYRHNLPRSVKVGSKLFVSVCVRKKGLILSSTRSVLFTRNETWIKQHRDNCYVEAIALANSRPGKKLNEVFEEIKKAYASVNRPHEWFLHHQGGLAGYNAREVVANEKTDYTLRSGNVVAWNPTITGTKSEDTFLILEDGLECLSYPETSEWPGVELQVGSITLRRPDIVLLRGGG